VEYLDRLAETAVKEAIQSLAANGKRANSNNVPDEALELFRRKGRGRVSASEAPKRIAQAIGRLRDRREIKAPQAPYNDWVVIGHGEPAAANESAE
jgi:hypothetical protein